jgi:hypothetical protein
MLAQAGESVECALCPLSVEQICIGPVCVPLNMFLPFLLGILHNYGWFNWIKKEWVTFRFYKRKLMRYVHLIFCIFNDLDLVLFYVYAITPFSDTLPDLPTALEVGWEKISPSNLKPLRTTWDLFTWCRWWNGAEPPQPATAAPTTAPSSDAGAPVVAGTCTDGAVVCEDSENADEGCVLATESVNGPGASPATDSSPAAVRKMQLVMCLVPVYLRNMPPVRTACSSCNVCSYFQCCELDEYRAHLQTTAHTLCVAPAPPGGY